MKKSTSNAKKQSSPKKSKSPKDSSTNETSNLKSFLDEVDLGLIGTEQPLFYYGPPPVLKTLYKNKGGFDKKFHPHDLTLHMSNGKTRAEVCAAWGITYSMFNNWLEEHPELAEAYAVGKPAYDAFYKRALRDSSFGVAKNVRENSLFFMLKNQAGFSDDGGNHEYSDGPGAELDFENESDT